MRPPTGPFRRIVMYRSLVLAGLLLGPSCVSYVADSADATRVAAEIGERKGGAFSYRSAVEAAFRDNAELRRLAANARAAGADLTPFDLQAQFRNHMERGFVTVDPIALLDLGPRGARNARLEREADAAAVALVEGRWRVAAAIAETFAIEDALASLPPVPPVPTTADAFADAGLGATTAVARFRAAQLAHDAEAKARMAAAERNLARLRELLGLAAEADVAFVLDEQRTGQPSKTPNALLARPDLTLQAARFAVADAAFRTAVADQYPAVTLGPDIPVTGSALDWIAMLRLPVGAWGRAEAARERRAAARAELEGAVLRAMREARDTELASAAAAATRDATESTAAASAQWLRSALVSLEVEVDGFDAAANAATMAMLDATMLRRAAVDAAVARVREAVAYGWPTVVADPESTAGAPATRSEELP